MERDMQIVRIGDRDHALHSAEKIGAKAANLTRMAALGLPIPPAFVLPVGLCGGIVAGDEEAERQLRQGLKDGIAFLEGMTGRQFGGRRVPLLVSVRSGAARSMPGMLDTVLDVGCTAPAVRGLVRMTGNVRFAWDCRRRFLEGYAETVLGLDPAPFAVAVADFLASEGAQSEHDLDCEALERIAVADEVLIGQMGEDLPDDPMEQLEAAARAVLRSWMSERACTYRRLQSLDNLQGTAVTVQAMVFGNSGPESGSGVAFSRDPSNGATHPVIDVLFDAQGEDVVSGHRSPSTEAALTRVLPGIADELREILQTLEREFRDAQDVEFTIEDGRLWILQTRAVERTPRAALKIAVDLVHEGLISEEEALSRLADLDPATLVESHLVDPAEPIAKGVGASAGIAVGRAAFDREAVTRLSKSGDPLVLLRPDVSTADVGAFALSAGIVTAVGGRTAHAALVARQMAKPCIVGCDGLTVDAGRRRAQLTDHILMEGDWLSVDGRSGHVHLGRQVVSLERPEQELAEIARWRSSRRLRETTEPSTG
jgi:pyruvate,orthophosphate dikinase